MWKVIIRALADYEIKTSIFDETIDVSMLCSAAI